MAETQTRRKQKIVGSRRRQVAAEMQWRGKNGGGNAAAVVQQVVYNPAAELAQERTSNGKIRSEMAA